MIDYTGFAFGKGTPRVIDRIAQKHALAAQERLCRAEVKQRDKGRCFYPDCRVAASELHHIMSRSVRGKTIWVTSDILSACNQHHRYFKAGLIRVEGNPDVAPVAVFLTSLGEAAKIRLPKRVA